MAIQSQPVPLNSTVDVLPPGDGDRIQAVKGLIQACADRSDPRMALNELLVLRDRLGECLQFAEDAIARLTERLEVQDLAVPDTDPVRFVPAGKVRRMPDEDHPLSCDPDDRTTD